MQDYEKEIHNIYVNTQQPEKKKCVAKIHFMNTSATLIGKLLPETNSSLRGNLWYEKQWSRIFFRFLYCLLWQQFTFLVHSQRKSTMHVRGDYYLISCIFIFFISSHNIKITTLINREKEQQNECVKWKMLINREIFLIGKWGLGNKRDKDWKKLEALSSSPWNISSIAVLD